MRLVVLSDTHGFHRGMPELPAGDVLIHCGDWSRDCGSRGDLLRFRDWMKEQPHAEKLVVPGNHDQGAEDAGGMLRDIFWEAGVVCLDGDWATEMEGVHFGGGPWMPPFVPARDRRWAFQAESEERARLWKAVPDCDVLLTHCPPHGILDAAQSGKNFGCEALRDRVLGMQPRLHLFGHVHEKRGITTIGPTSFINACCNSRMTFARQPDRTSVSLTVWDPVLIDLHPDQDPVVIFPEKRTVF